MPQDQIYSSRQIPLSDLLEAIGVSVDDQTPVVGITADSRQVRPGMVFVAVRGTAADGHRFIPQAVEAGASAIVAEELPDSPLPVPAFSVPDSRVALGHLASRFYGDPSEELTLVGVTGTNGKTTVATLLYQLAGEMGLKAGLISTVANIIGTETIPADHTTPDPVTLNALLRRMVDAGCSFAAMEVSSHAADQHRIAGLSFAGGIFTNLTRDHLDYHKTVGAYLAAKKSFFDGLSSQAWALTNADDRNGTVMVQNTAARPVAFYSLRSEADFHVKPLEIRFDGMLLAFDGTDVEVRLTGAFNASNLAAVYGAALLLGYKRESVLRGLSKITGAPGRFQTFHSHDGVTAIVDFAHTPDALENLLDTIDDMAPLGAAVTVVCGAGGDRDKGKRPLMAHTAAARCNRLILTSDNPRTEDPEAILDDMAAGLSADELARTLRIADRREAIRRAIAAAAPGDIVAVCGKGHETTQTIGTQVHHFDDREEVQKALDNRESGIGNRETENCNLKSETGNLKTEN